MAKMKEQAFDKAKILDAIEEFKRKQVEPIKEQIEVVKGELRTKQSELDDLEEVLAELTGKARSQGGGVSSGKHVRRSKEQKQADAKAIYDFIKASGKDGVSGSQIRKNFGERVKAGTTIKNFLEDEGFEVKPEGQKAAMRYIAK